jgi:Tfp pilus assembly protein PilO
MATNNNPRHLPAAIQVIAVVAIALALSGAAFFFGIPGVIESPWQLGAQRDALDTTRAGLKSENEAAEHYESNLSEYESQANALGEQLDRILVIVPGEPQTEQLKKLIERDAAAAHVHLDESFAQPQVVRDFFTETPVHWHVDGGYEAVSMFFDRLGGEERIINVSKLAVRPLSPAKTAKPSVRPGEPVDANFVMTTYFAKL